MTSQRRIASLSAAMNLLERAAPLAELERLFRHALRSQGVHCLLTGEAGIGKSVLVQGFTRSVEKEARALVGLCDPLSTPRPLAPLADIAGRLDVELKRALEQGERDRVFRRLLERLQSAPEPTVVVFEDVHWADEATLDLLRFLGRRIGSTRALLITTYRDDEVGAAHPLRVVLGDLATSGTLVRIGLSPLSESAVRLLAEGTDIKSAELHRLTGGNPFFVTEVIAAGVDCIPQTVSDAVLARAARLSPEGKAALEAAAVIGNRVEPWLLSGVAGTSSESADECLATGILLLREGNYAFRHELARNAIYDSLTLQRKRELHKVVLGCLEASAPDDVAMLAHHAEGAVDAQAVLAYAPEAGRQAMNASANREAAAQYERALRFAVVLPQLVRAELLAQYADLCCTIDHQAEAIRAFESAAAIFRASGEKAKAADCLRRLAITYTNSGRTADADQTSREALRLLAGIEHGVQLARCQITEGQLRMLSRDNASAIAWSNEAIALGMKLDDKAILSAAHNILGTAQLLAGDVEAGEANVLKAVDLAPEPVKVRARSLTSVNLGIASGELYRLARAEKHLSKAIDICTEHDMDWGRIHALACLALVYVHQGRWSEASSTAASVVEHPRPSLSSRNMALVAFGRLRARRGDPEVWSALDEALGLALQSGTLPRLGATRSARAEAAYLAGDVEKTLDEARAAFGLAVEKEHPWFVGELAYWRWKAGDLSEVPLAIAEPFKLQLTGDWRAAAREWQRLGCPYEEARALSEADDEAALKEGLSIFGGLGARPSAAFVARRLRERGAKGIPRGPRASTRANPANLTARELEILGLVAEGLSNPAIAKELHLSTKTVGHHVSSILAKLEVKSRIEAVNEAARRSLLGEAEQASKQV